MNSDDFTSMKIDIVNIYDVVMAIAKHAVGQMTDDDLKEFIEPHKGMLNQAKEGAALVAIKELLRRMGEGDEE